ncbi:MAG: hypothetical protein U9Q73_01390 [Nanoarchaeota archaeon]|nr:hypothetical protein [Nanoarchaeota archaeon]
MKKTVVLLSLMMMLVLTSFTVSAVVLPEKNVVVGGTIYTPEGAPLGDADVTVTCNEYNETTTSNSEGDYGVEFDNSQGTICAVGDTVTVIAVKDDLSGIESDVVTDFPLTVNLVVINVPMTPEFGFVMGIMTLLGSAGIFFIVKKN